MRSGVVAAYAVPAAAIWAGLGLATGGAVAALGWTVALLAMAAAYGGYYGAVEASGGRGLAPPGRRWQVPQTMLIDASPRRRVLVWGAILGPGFVTRNPYAGFGWLPLAVAAMPGPGAAMALGAAIGVTHGAARAAALLRDVGDLRMTSAMAVAGAASGPGGAVTTHLDLLLRTLYWRRVDGVALLAAAATAALAAGHYVS